MQLFNDKRTPLATLGLMAGLEIEDPATTALVAAAAPEDLATLEPADEDGPVGGRDIERLAVHLLRIDHE